MMARLLFDKAVPHSVACSLLTLFWIFCFSVVFGDIGQIKTSVQAEDIQSKMIIHFSWTDNSLPLFNIDLLEFNTNKTKTNPRK